MVVKSMTRGIGAACAIAALMVAAPRAQSAVKPLPTNTHYVPPRTPDGQPDIQGTWVNFDDTPFEASAAERRSSDVNPPSVSAARTCIRNSSHLSSASIVPITRMRRVRSS